MDARPHGGELRLFGCACLDLERAGNCRLGVRKDQHEGVPDLLDDATAPGSDGNAYDLGEAFENAGSSDVAHGLGQWREAGKIDKDDGH